MPRSRFLLALTLLLAGCAAPAPSTGTAQRAASLAPQAADTAFGTRILAAFERLPDSRRSKAATASVQARDGDPGVATIVVTRMKGAAVTAIQDAQTQTSWEARWKATDLGLQSIRDMKLSGFGKRNVPALMGLHAARGYGYIGLHPTTENRYRVQVATLEYLSRLDGEASLTIGSPLFTLGAATLEATTSWDQGLRVGISVLSVLGEYYQDRPMRKSCQALLEHAARQGNKEDAYLAIRDGLHEMARRLDEPR
ncbi:MAG: hypothetical protein VKP62_12425 [Candidatus Sericytochromatia bacterium]|nr:hypothetical protein [Candidatus Sericytochromatia bacterium]